MEGSAAIKLNHDVLYQYEKGSMLNATEVKYCCKILKTVVALEKCKILVTAEIPENS